MSSYYVLLTDYGKSIFAKAHTSVPIQLTSVVLGDANNQPYVPESRLSETNLLNQKVSIPITSVKVLDSGTAEVTVLIPYSVGGFNIHEIGITDATDQLVYIGNFHGGYRPIFSEGAGGDMEIIFTIKTNNIAKVIIEVEPYTATATKKWVNETFSIQFSKHIASYLELIFPIGCKYWTHSSDNPKPQFDLLFGKETFWRRLHGVQLVSVEDGDTQINQTSMYIGKNGSVHDNAYDPDHYQLYTGYLWERYDPVTVLTRYDGLYHFDGTATF